MKLLIILCCLLLISCTPLPRDSDTAATNSLITNVTYENITSIYFPSEIINALNERFLNDKYEFQFNLGTLEDGSNTLRIINYSEVEYVSRNDTVLLRKYNYTGKVMIHSHPDGISCILSPPDIMAAKNFNHLSGLICGVDRIWFQDKNNNSIKVFITSKNEIKEITMEYEFAKCFNGGEWYEGWGCYEPCLPSQIPKVLETGRPVCYTINYT